MSTHTQPETSKVFVIVVTWPIVYISLTLIPSRISWLRFRVAKRKRPCLLVSFTACAKWWHITMVSVELLYSHLLPMTIAWPMKDWIVNNASFLCTQFGFTLCTETTASSTEHCCEKHCEQEWFPTAGHFLHPPSLCRRVHI